MTPNKRIIDGLYEMLQAASYTFAFGGGNLLDELAAHMSGGPDQINAICQYVTNAHLNLWPGDQVWWEDPEGICSKVDVVRHLVSDSLVVLESWTECLPGELILINSPRNPRTTPLSLTEIMRRMDHNSVIEDCFVMDIEDLCEYYPEDRRDRLAEIAVGNRILQDVRYELVGVAEDGSPIVRISGKIAAPLALSEG